MKQKLRNVSRILLVTILLICMQFAAGYCSYKLTDSDLKNEISETTTQEIPSVEAITKEIVEETYTETETTEIEEITTEEQTIEEIIETTVEEEEVTDAETTAYAEQAPTVYVHPVSDTSALRYMASIIYAEAGDQCYAGQCAVGIVVMNRIRNDEFPDNIYDVIYQRGQFTPTTNGSFDKALYLYDTGQLQESCISAAEYALNGNTTIECYGEVIDFSSYHFFSMYMSNYRFVLQDHYFK